MARVLLTVKLFLVFAYHGFAAVILQSTAQVMIEKHEVLNDKILIGVIGVFLVVVLLPEIALAISSGFRAWVKQGVEDADGKFNKSDFKDAMIIYVSIWVMRVFLAFSVAKMFGVEIDTTSYLATLFASFGIAGLTVIKSFFTK